MKKNPFVVVLLAAAPAFSATVSLSIVSPVTPSFDVTVQVADVFGGRAGDLVEAYGFNVTAGSPAFSFIGSDAGPLFSDLSGFFLGSPAVAGLARNPAGIGAGDFAGALVLAVLHFRANSGGTATIGITSDSTDLNQGLIYANLPYGALNASALVTAAPVPEPETFALAVAACAVALLWRTLFTVIQSQSAT